MKISRGQARDNLPRDSYHVRAVGEGLETAIAELTEQIGGGGGGGGLGAGGQG